MIFGGFQVTVDDRLQNIPRYRRWWQFWKPRIVGFDPPFFRTKNNYLVTNSYGRQKLIDHTNTRELISDPTIPRNYVP